MADIQEGLVSEGLVWRHFTVITFKNDKKDFDRCKVLRINGVESSENFIRVFNFYLQAYENYSFEELRFAAPAVPRPSENMLVRCNSDGTYVANWTPSNIGLYNIHVTIDDFDTGTL